MRSGSVEFHSAGTNEGAPVPARAGVFEAAVFAFPVQGLSLRLAEGWDHQGLLQRWIVQVGQRVASALTTPEV